MYFSGVTRKRMKHFFYKGKNNVLAEESFDEKVAAIKKELSKVLESRNISFLIGSGCSLGIGGIPTMKGLADGFFKNNENVTDNVKALLLSKADIKFLKEQKINYSEEPFVSNLEVFLGTLYSLKFYYEQIKDDTNITAVSSVINQTKKYILYHCLNKQNQGKDTEVENNYKNFYRKLSLRDSNLPKPNIFTTNYDLYSEMAMDELGITYTNGFSGFIARYFNPSIFKYALAEQMDISSFKWNVIDSFIYLFKIHGSVNWVEIDDNNKLFKIKELQECTFESLSAMQNIMIYPSPIKQNASLGTPYSDLFREFQKRIAQNQSVLITMGYSFCDEHINNLVYQALTIPTFRLVIFSEMGHYVGDKHVCQENIKRLLDLNDPRIWIIGSDKEYTDNAKENEVNPEKSLYFFSTITEDLLPDWAENQIQTQNEKVITLMNNSTQP